MNTRLILYPVASLLSLSLFSGCSDKQEEEPRGSAEVAVQVGKATRVTLRAHVDAYGIVEGEPSATGKPAGSARLSAPTAGIVMAVSAKEGDRVEAGTVIVKLDDRVAVAQMEKARHAVGFAEQQMARQDKLKSIEGTSERAIQETAQQLAAAKGELALAEAQLALAQLTAPLSGIVTRIHVQPGQAVEPNTVVAEVVDPERLVASLKVSANESMRLKVGQPADLLLERGEKVEAQGKVLYVAPQVDSATDTVLVRVSLPANAGFRIGQFVHAQIVTEERANTLAVPREAIYTDYDGNSTLSVVEGDIAKQQTVKVGLRDGDLVEVEGEGIAEGATVVTLGSYALPKETKVRILTPGEVK